MKKATIWLPCSWFHIARPVPKTESTNPESI